MSDNIDYVAQLAWGLEEEEDVELTDWTKLKEEVMAGPFGIVWDEGHMQEEDYVAAGTQPVNRRGQPFTQMLPPANLSPLRHTKSTVPAGSVPAGSVPAAANYVLAAPFTCDIEGCALRYKRRGDLNRHKLKHGSQKRHECSAVNCGRTGSKGFTREDKLIDHILSGHDDDTLFLCTTCGNSFSRDLMRLHMDGEGSYSKRAHLWRKVVVYRTCPMPRCSFKARQELGWSLNRSSVKDWAAESVKNMQVHLLEKHDRKGRANFAGLLANKGYNFQSGKICCPICSSHPISDSLQDFEQHFSSLHAYVPLCGEHADASCPGHCMGRQPENRMEKCRSMSANILENRCTLLKIWPAFEYFPIWDDIKCPGANA